MTEAPRYRKGHPGLYRRKIPIFWWVYKSAHARFVLRELTSLAVAFYSVTLLVFVYKVSHGETEYSNFLTTLANPVFVAANGVALVLAIFHSITWFNLAPKAMVIRLRGRKVPGLAILVLNLVAWFVVSGALILAAVLA